MFLPQRWKDSNISPDVSYVSMDPNLTVAHLNHNASMILLHQHIAYPPVDWSGIVKLPSSCSAETCQLAAVETASIAKKYLTHTEGDIVASQFPFCAFVAARVMLGEFVNTLTWRPWAYLVVHWRYNDTTLSPEFFSIIESLKEMSRRWQGFLVRENDQVERQDLDAAAKYALELEELHARCLSDANYRMDNFGYSDESSNSVSPATVPRHEGSASSQSSQVRRQSFNHRPAETTSPPTRPSNTNRRRSLYAHRQSFSSASGPFNAPQNGRLQPLEMHPMASPSNGMRIDPLEGGSTGGNPGGINNSGLVNMNYPGEIMDDELTAMSHILLGQQFLEMDRVITLDGTDFDIDMSNWGDMH
jgi:hypothetical protein